MPRCRINLGDVRALCANKRKGFVLECLLHERPYLIQELINTINRKELQDKVLIVSNLQGIDVLGILKDGMNQL